MCVLIKERVESEALKKGATLEDIAEMYPGIFNSTKVSMETLRSLATLLDCDVDYITGRDLNSGQSANFEFNTEISIDHLEKAMRRFPMLNCKVLSYLVSGTPYTIYGARKDKKLAPRYIKNAAYYLNCSYDFLTNDDCTSIGKPSTLPSIPKNFQAIDNKSIVAKAGILNITPASLGSKCKIGSVNGTRICNSEIKFLPPEIISTLASVLKCTTQEIVSPAYLNNSSTVSASTMIEDEFDEMESLMKNRIVKKHL